MSPAPPEPSPRESRPAAPTRTVVLRAALGIVDADGIDGLSMRRLARALDRDPMTLYRYADGKGALLDGIAELVTADLVVDPTGEDWRGELRRVAHRFRELALAHPHVVPLLVTRPLGTPLGRRPLGTVRPVEALIELLVRGGFDPAQALSAVRLVLGFLYGHVLTELQELLVDNESETDEVLRLGLQHLPLVDFPRLRALAPELADYDGAVELDAGLDILLAGLQERLAAHGTAADPGQG